MDRMLSMLMRWQIIQSTRPHIQTFSRAKSSKAEEDDDEEMPEVRGKLMDSLMASADNDVLPLDQRLTDMGLDPQEYKTYGNRFRHTSCYNRADID